MILHENNAHLTVIANPRHLKAANECTTKQEIKLFLRQYTSPPKYKQAIVKTVINNLLAAEV